MNYVDVLADWVATHQNQIQQSGVVVKLTLGPIDRSKRAGWLDLESARKLARLIVWETGEADLEIGDVETGNVTPAHKDMQSEADLDTYISAVLRQL